MQFFHTIPMREKDLVHEVTATWKHGYFVHRAKSHERYFASLDEFVRWHYTSQGWKIADETFPFGSEAKSFYGEACDLFAYQPMWVKRENYAAHLKVESRNDKY